MRSSVGQRNSTQRNSVNRSRKGEVLSETMRGIEELTEADYEFGFSTDLDTDVAPPG